MPKISGSILRRQVKILSHDHCSCQFGDEYLIDGKKIICCQKCGAIDMLEDFGEVAADFGFLNSPALALAKD